MDKQLANYALVHPSGLIVNADMARHIPLLETDQPPEWRNLSEIDEEQRSETWLREMMAWLRRSGASTITANVWGDVDPEIFHKHGFIRDSKLVWDTQILDDTRFDFLLYIGFEEISIRNAAGFLLAVVVETWDGFLLRVGGDPMALSLAEYRENVLKKASD